MIAASIVELARVLFRTPSIRIGFESLEPVAEFCSAGVFVSLLSASYGLDLSPGFF